MPVFCFGPVCIPMNLLLPFLLGIAHRYGWLRWIKREWVTFTWWKQQFSRSKQQPAAGCDSSQQHGTASTAGSGPRYVCEGDVCRLVPPEDPHPGNEQQQAPPADSDSDGDRAAAVKAAAPAGASKVRHRRA